MTDDTRTVQKNLQYHFVVVWNEASGTWEVDAETLDAKFDTEVIWDKDSNNWVSYEDDDELREDFTNKEDALATILQQFNSNFREGVLE
jgi:beta-xylosidase